MLKEAIEYLFAKGAADRRAVVQTIDDRRSLLVHREGHDWIAPPQPIYKHAVVDLESLVAAITEWRAEDQCCVFVGVEQVVAILNRKDGLDRVTLHLHRSEPWRLLDDLTHPKAQKQLLYRLRVTYLPINPHLAPIIAALEQLRWAHSNVAESGVRREDKALSRSISSKVTGADQLPDSFELSMPVFTNFGDEISETFTCALIQHPEEEQLEVALEPDAKTLGMLRAQNLVKKKIEHELEDLVVTCPVLLGNP